MSGAWPDIFVFREKHVTAQSLFHSLVSWSVPSLCRLRMPHEIYGSLIATHDNDESVLTMSYVFIMAAMASS